MTSTVKVIAHCAANKHVQLRIVKASGHPFENNTVLEIFYLEDGETKEVYVYDDRYVITRELLK